ncbi:MAG: hypothetical protein J0I20_08515 [Chloroflexi bacterium]|nr:hypothetical protein [Chloroflexota bacterium]
MVTEVAASAVTTEKTRGEKGVTGAVPTTGGVVLMAVVGVESPQAASARHMQRAPA